MYAVVCASVTDYTEVCPCVVGLYSTYEMAREAMRSDFLYEMDEFEKEKRDYPYTTALRNWEAQIETFDECDNLIHADYWSIQDCRVNE